MSPVRNDSPQEDLGEGLPDDLEALLKSSPIPPDHFFDRHMPARWLRKSERHWSSLAACRRAAELFSASAGHQILDVGSGVGKFCIAAALSSPASFVGVEQREDLVYQARSLSKRFRSERASFIEGNAFDLDWRQYQGLYFYNPFAELLFPADERIDDRVKYDIRLYQEMIDETAERLRSMPIGTRVVTYNTAGCIMPRSYVLVTSETIDYARLELWRQVGEFPMPSERDQVV